eukprot:3242381-Amphidinium_carterae.1
MQKQKQRFAFSCRSSVLLSCGGCTVFGDRVVPHLKRVVPPCVVTGISWAFDRTVSSFVLPQVLPAAASSV